MSKKNTAAVVASPVTTVELNGLTELKELKAKESELKAKKRLLMTLNLHQKWEEATLARNPNYVMGSLRRATPEDTEILGHTHGFVCEIACESCGTRRVVNKQDAFQARFCQSCKKEATKARNSAKRAAKRLQGKSPEQIQAEIDQLNAQLSTLKA